MKEIIQRLYQQGRFTDEIVEIPEADEALIEQYISELNTMENQNR